MLMNKSTISIKIKCILKKRNVNLSVIIGNCFERHNSNVLKYYHKIISSTEKQFKVSIQVQII